MKKLFKKLWRVKPSALQKVNQKMYRLLEMNESKFWIQK